MKFYKKKTSVLDLLTSETKLKMNWDLVKNGADVNEVFKMNPVGLDEFLKDNKQDLEDLLENVTNPNYKKDDEDFSKVW